ncbi:MAG: isochorismatase family protein [Ferrimicrobium acidiphilum]
MLDVLVIDPQIGWCERYPGVPRTFHKLAKWLSTHELWDRATVAYFVNDESSPFRAQMSWWGGFRSQSDYAIIDPYDKLTGKIVVHNTYGMPDEFWQSRPDKLLIAGVEADASVAKVAMDAFDRGIEVYVSPDFLASAYGLAGLDTGVAVLAKVLGKQRVLDAEDLEQLLLS